MDNANSFPSSMISLNSQVLVAFDEDKTRFYQLMKEWNEERKYMSILEDGLECHACQQIIEMGNDAIPMILKEMRKATKAKGIELAYWSLVLEKITGGNPDSKNTYHNPNVFVDAWVKYLEDYTCKNQLGIEHASQTSSIETTQSQAHQTIHIIALDGQPTRWIICAGGAQSHNMPQTSFGRMESQEVEMFHHSLKR